MCDSDTAAGCVNGAANSLFGSGEGNGSLEAGSRGIKFALAVAGAVAMARLGNFSHARLKTLNALGGSEGMSKRATSNSHSP